MKITIDYIRLDSKVWRLPVQGCYAASWYKIMLPQASFIVALPSLAHGFLMFKYSCLNSSHHTFIPASRKEGEQKGTFPPSL